MCVLGYGFWFRRTIPGWGLWCVRLSLSFGLHPAIPGWVSGVRVFVCVLRLYPAVPGWGVWCGCVCFGWGFGCALPLLAGVLGSVCVCVRAPLVTRHSWLGCAVWVCLLGFWCRLRLTTPGWGVGVCVCFCARCACTPPLLAGVCGVCVCAWAWVSGAPRHSWLGCWGVCVFMCALRSYPATPGLGMRRGCLCEGSGFGCAPPNWLGCWGLSVFVWALRLYPGTPGWGPLRGCVCLNSDSVCAPPLLAGVIGCVCFCVRAPLVPCHCQLHVWCGCGCLSSGFGCAPPLLAGLLGCVCVCVRASLVPCHSWLGCAVWVCVLGLRFRLCSAIPGWWVRVCVCLCACSACSPLPLAGVCGVGVCAWVRVRAALCHSWLGCWGVCEFVCVLRLYPATPGWGVWCGCVCLGLGFGCAPPLVAGVLGCVRVCPRALLVPCHSWLGFVACVRLLGPGLRLRPSTPGWGVGVCVCLCAR